MVHNVHWWDRSSIGCSCPKNLSQISMKNHGHMIFGFFPFSCNCTVLSVSIIPTRELLFSFQFFSISFCTALSDSTNWLDSLQFFFFSFWALSDYTNWLDSLQDFFNLFLNILVFKPFFFFERYNWIQTSYWFSMLQSHWGMLSPISHLNILKYNLNEKFWGKLVETDGNV